MKTSITLSGAALLAIAQATPTPVVKRADSCEQWGSVVTGDYTVYNNLWGEGSATSGSQCFGVDGLDGNSVSWHASWTWEGGQYSTNGISSELNLRADKLPDVKSYPNVVVNSNGQQISAISSMPSVWSWTYEGNDIVADVAYDLFTSSTAGGSNEFEIMVWLAALGGAGPISSTFLHSPTVPSRH